MFAPGRTAATVIGGRFVLYAMVIYPALGLALGHGYPSAPMFGVAPCPLTIFTLGLLLWANADARLPKGLLVVPVLWSLLGVTAALQLGIREDLGLLVAGVTTVVVLLGQRLSRRPVRPRSGPPRLTRVRGARERAERRPPADLQPAGALTKRSLHRSPPSLTRSMRQRGTPMATTPRLRPPAPAGRPAPPRGCPRSCGTGGRPCPVCSSGCPSGSTASGSGGSSATSSSCSRTPVAAPAGCA